MLKQLLIGWCLMASSVAIHASGMVAALRMLRRKERDRSWTWLFVFLAGWIILGLEFALGADIARTAIAPTWDDIGQLAAIAAIRTMLNYFLEKDVEAARAELEARSAKAEGWRNCCGSSARRSRKPSRSAASSIRSTTPTKSASTKT